MRELNEIGWRGDIEYRIRIHLVFTISQVIIHPVQSGREIVTQHIYLLLVRTISHRVLMHTFIQDGPSDEVQPL